MFLTGKSLAMFSQQEWKSCTIECQTCLPEPSCAEPPLLRQTHLSAPYSAAAPELSREIWPPWWPEPENLAQTLFSVSSRLWTAMELRFGLVVRHYAPSVWISVLHLHGSVYRCRWRKFVDSRNPVTGDDKAIHVQLHTHWNCCSIEKNESKRLVLHNTTVGSHKHCRLLDTKRGLLSDLFNLFTAH